MRRFLCWLFFGHSWEAEWRGGRDFHDATEFRLCCRHCGEPDGEWESVPGARPQLRVIQGGKAAGGAR